MSNIMTGEVIFGGPGSGLFGMLLLVVLAVFLAGLMVGRTPEYLGKKLGTREIKLAVLGTLFVPALTLTMTAIVTSIPAGRQSSFSHGPQGYSEALYAYLSQANNNGSAFAGYTGFIQPTPGNVGAHGIAFADIAGGLAMTFGRFVPILFVLALAGSLAARRTSPFGLGTLRTDTPTFVVFLIGFVIVFVLLNFVAALFLGPLDQSLTSRLYG
jgi:K+-transporting ATPase ATPase A chain